MILEILSNTCNNNTFNNAFILMIPIFGIFKPSASSFLGLKIAWGKRTNFLLQNEYILQHRLATAAHWVVYNTFIVYLKFAERANPTISKWGDGRSNLIVLVIPQYIHVCVKL